MIRRILPVLILSAFVAGPIASPAMAADDKTASKCEKIKDMKLKAQCLRQSTQPRK